MANISKIIDIIKKTADINDDVEINKDSSLILDLGLSSFEMCLLLCELEEEFHVNIDFDNIDNSVTIGKLYELLVCKEVI